jgi:hypothetical protein
MTTEDEEFNRIEREADMRRKAVSAALKDHIEHMRQSMTEYERGVIDGRQMQMQSSVDKAVNAMSKREWIGLTDEEIWGAVGRIGTSNSDVNPYQTIKDARAIEKLLKEKNEM